MKPWIRRTLIGVAGLGLVFGGLAACSHRMGHGWPASEADAAQWRERIVHKASRELDLDAAQQAKLNGLAEAMAAQRRALVGEMGANPRAEFQALIAGPQFDRAKGQALLDAKTGALRDGAPQVMSAAADFYDSLKPEQQQKLRDFMAKGRHGHWRT
ncbi:Spy/CpxP family protein refolding chaperone [Ideonella sp. DXS22W]|uniref:Spy/CpxP family protein refolding chaperone n=1 Tax=Pseudaquabacterium inlustre TaxID=2984192 RepID=A0ABU9CDW7_9BURK